MIEVSVRTFYVSDEDGVTLAPAAIFLLKDEAKPVDVAAIAKALAATLETVLVASPRAMTDDEVHTYRTIEDAEEDVAARPYSDVDDDEDFEE